MKRIVGVLLGAFVLVTACGGGSSALSKDEFVKQGNSICQKGNDEINAAGNSLFSNSSSQPDTATLQKYFNETVAPNIKKQIDDIDKLKAPKELQAQADKLVTDARAALAKLQDQVNKDPEAAFNSSEDPFTDVNKTATAIGLAACASNSESSSS